MKIKFFTLLVSTTVLTSCAGIQSHSSDIHAPVSNQVIANQRQLLKKNTTGKGFGAQSPRNIDLINGNNPRLFNRAPPSEKMNLCNIHFHKNAEHQGGEFTTYAGNGDGHGFQSGYKYSGQLSSSERTDFGKAVCPSPHGGLSSGDTIEVHYVYSTAQVKPGSTLSACLGEAIKNPQLRVETQVYVLVNDKKAQSFKQLTQYGLKDGFQQALNIPNNTGAPIQYEGSTTGPSYNETGSPFQVTWRVRPKVVKVNIETVAHWCQGNIFQEDHAHGVRNLVTNPDLLSIIKR